MNKPKNFPVPEAVLKALLDVQPLSLSNLCRNLNLGRAGVVMTLNGKSLAIGRDVFRKLMSAGGLDTDAADGEILMASGFHLWVITKPLQVRALEILSRTFGLRKRNANLAISTGPERKKWACFHFEVEEPHRYEILIAVRIQLGNDLENYLPPIQKWPKQFNADIGKLIGTISATTAEDFPPHMVVEKYLQGAQPITNLPDDADHDRTLLDISANIRTYLRVDAHFTDKDKEVPDAVAEETTFSVEGIDFGELHEAELKQLEINKKEWRRNLQLGPSRTREFFDLLVFKFSLSMLGTATEIPFGAVRLHESMLTTTASIAAARRNALEIHRSDTTVYYIERFTTNPEDHPQASFPIEPGLYLVHVGLISEEVKNMKLVVRLRQNALSMKEAQLLDAEIIDEGWPRWSTKSILGQYRPAGNNPWLLIRTTQAEDPEEQFHDFPEFQISGRVLEVQHPLHLED